MTRKEIRESWYIYGKDGFAIIPIPKGWKPSTLKPSVSKREFHIRILKKKKLGKIA